MSTLKVNNLQVGQDATASNNFTLYQPAVPDGTVRLGVGNSGSVSDLLTINDSSAKLKISTLTGTTGLNVVGLDTNGYADVEITSVGTSGSSRLYFSDTAGKVGSIIYNHSDNSLNFATNGGSTDLKIFSDGSTRILDGDLIVGNFDVFDTRNSGGVHIDQSAGITFKSNSSQSVSRSWRIRNDDWGWGNLDFGVGDTVSDWSDSAGDTVLSLTSSRNVGIGTTNPSTKLNVVGSGYNQINISSTTGANVNKLGGITSLTYAGTNFSVFQTYASSGNGNNIYYGSADGSYRGVQNHYFYVNTGAEATTGHSLALRITSTGNVLIGNSATGSLGGIQPALQVDRPSSSVLNASILIRENEANTSWPKLYLSKNRSDNPMGPDNKLGSIEFYGDNGSNDELGARIEATADGTNFWSTTSRPTRLVFSVTPEGSTTLTEALRIDPTGNVGIGTDNPSKKLHVIGDIRQDYSTRSSGSFQVNPNGGTKTIVISGLQNGCCMFHMGGYSSAGQSQMHECAIMGGFMTATNTYNVTRLASWIGGNVSYTYAKNGQNVTYVITNSAIYTLTISWYLDDSSSSKITTVTVT